MVEDFDAIIIGAGQSGPFLAVRLAEQGQKVALIEREHLGGPASTLSIHPFSSSSFARNAAIASAAARSLNNPREIVVASGGPPDDLPV